MRIRPGFGMPRDPRINAEIKREWERTRDSNGSSLILGKAALDWYEPLGLAREHRQPNGDIYRHQNAVDAFRHAYTAGMLYGIFGESLIFAASLVEWINSELPGADRSDVAAGMMDIQNNLAGLELYKELVKRLGGRPTEEQFAEHVLEAVASGKLKIRNSRSDGWEKRLLEEQDRRIQRSLHEALERAMRESPRSDRENRKSDHHVDRRRDYDRSERRPGYGEGKALYA